MIKSIRLNINKPKGAYNFRINQASGDVRWALNKGILEVTL